jgi:hypothetical protein
MRYVPEVVFINCCHLGKTTSTETRRFGSLAANLGVQFINMGVKAVIAAGWAVEDNAATAFADSFYRHLLAGETFGEAAQMARRETWSRYRGVNTWGAYQCYGDPGFRLFGGGNRTATQRLPQFHSPAQLVAGLNNLAAEISMQSENDGHDPEQARARSLASEITNLFNRVPEIQRQHWQQRADVAAAVGFAWGEASAWEEALEWLERALRSDTGDCPIRAVEQCANFRVRLVGSRWQEIRQRGSEDEVESERNRLVDQIEETLRELDLINLRAPTAQRYRLLGSACKRLAWLSNRSGARREALINMERYYRAARECEPSRKTYAFTNWAMSTVLTRHYESPGDDSWRQPLQAEAMAQAAEARRLNAQSPNFWNAVGEPDCELVHLLVDLLSGTPTMSAEAVEDACARITELYRDAGRRGVSPRAFSSVLEHLDFLVEHCNAIDAAAAGTAIANIRNALS